MNEAIQSRLEKILRDIPSVSDLGLANISLKRENDRLLKMVEQLTQENQKLKDQVSKLEMTEKYLNSQLKVLAKLNLPTPVNDTEEESTDNRDNFEYFTIDTTLPTPLSTMSIFVLIKNCEEDEVDYIVSEIFAASYNSISEIKNPLASLLGNITEKLLLEGGRTEKSRNFVKFAVRLLQRTAPQALDRFVSQFDSVPSLREMFLTFLL